MNEEMKMKITKKKSCWECYHVRKWDKNFKMEKAKLLGLMSCFTMSWIDVDNMTVTHNVMSSSETI